MEDLTMKNGEKVGVYAVVIFVLISVVFSCTTMKVASTSELVGTWTGTSTPDGQEQGMQVMFEMREDGTFTEEIENPEITFSGRYRVDGATSMLHVTVESTSDASIVPVGASFTQDIEISRDGRTFWATGGGSSGKFDRQ